MLNMNHEKSDVTTSKAELILREIYNKHGKSIVEEFYDTLMKSDEARVFLEHSAVHQRMNGELLNWLHDILCNRSRDISPDSQDRQSSIGAVHARIKIPIHLLMLGALLIKKRIMQILVDIERDRHSAMGAAQLANERIDTAIMQMSEAYVQDTASRARLDEAFRAFSTPLDAAVEKEAQKASLLEWSQKTLFCLLRRPGSGELDQLSLSPFGVWIRRRADFAFEPSNLFHELDMEIRNIDEALLPALEKANSAKRQNIVAQLQGALDRILSLMSKLFETLTAMENGRDPLTRVLNRRFLPAILGREITLANEHGSPLSIIMADIDHFKQINDEYGHQAGDLTLRRAADIISESVRASDFVFRYGGEEFLIVLPETDCRQGELLAEQLRLRFAKEEFDFGDAVSRPVTASFGLAAHTGHPDPQYLIKCADEALYRAKEGGRNRVEIAPAGGVSRMRTRRRRAQHSQPGASVRP